MQDSNEIVFVLGEDHFRVDKQQLIQKSQYFSALFSGKYKDSAITEVPIKLKWSYKNLLTFTFWINENKEYDELYYRDFKARFKEDLISDIMELIDIANYFVVDQLVKDLKKIIIEYHLNSKKALYLWLQVRNQPMMKDLRDLSFALCVEFFDKLPRSELLELSYEDFIELVGNVNLQSDKDFLKKIMLDWHDMNNSKFGINLDNFFQIMYLILKDKDYQDMLQCSVNYRINDCQNLILYIWDGVSVTEKILQLPFQNEKKLNGTRILFHGFDMYLIGGQFEYKEFNTDIWRYSFLTEQWYYVTGMPQALRHMIVIFWKTRLYLIGGTGRYRLKFENQIYYDIETGIWGPPETIQGFFTDHSLACIVENKIFVLRSLPYFFDPRNNTWVRLCKRSNIDNELPMTGVKSVQSYDDMIIFLVNKPVTNNYNKTEVWSFHCGDKEYGMVESSIPMSALVTNKNEIIGFHETEDKVTISTLHFSTDYRILSRFYYIHNIKNQISCADISLGFFNLRNPDSLYKKRPDLTCLI